MNILDVNLYDAYTPLSFQSRKPKVNKEQAVSAIQEAVVPMAAAAVTAVTALTSLVGSKTASLDVAEVQRDIENGMSLRMIANKYNTKVSTIRVFMQKHNLSTNDGKILKTITKEDLQRCIEANMSAKEIAERYGLSNAGSLSPLYKIFGLNAPTQGKIDSVAIDEMIEYKKKRMTDMQIADKFKVSCQFVASKLKSYGIVARNINQCRGYTMEEIQDLVNQNSVEDVAKILGYTTSYFRYILRERGIEIPPQNEVQRFHLKKSQLKEKINADQEGLKDKSFWENIVMTKKNISFYTKVLERSDLKNLDWKTSSLPFRLSKYDCWQDAEKIIDTIPENNPLNLSGDEIMSIMEKSVSKENRNNYPDFTDNVVNLYNYVVKNVPEVKAPDFIKLMSLRRTDKELDKIINDKNLQPYKQMLMYGNVIGENYIDMLDVLSKNPHLLEDSRVQAVFNNAMDSNTHIMYKILTDENLAEEIELLAKNHYSNNENYIDLLETFSKNSELLYSPRVRMVLSGYPAEATYNAALINSVVQKIDDSRDIDKVIKYMDGDFVSNIFCRKRLGMSYFLPSFMKLSPKLINNPSLMKYFDTIMNSLSYTQAKFKIQFLQEVDANPDLLNNEAFAQNLAFRVLSVKTPENVREQLNDV